MEITRELGNSEAMKPFVKREILPGDLEGEALDSLIRDGAMCSRARARPLFGAELRLTGAGGSGANCVNAA